MSQQSETASPEEERSGGARRLAKVIARSGFCSRRDAERLIGEGRVVLNGQRVESPAVNVKDGDAIEVDGAPLPAAEAPRLWRYHKPRGRVTTHRDTRERPTVFEALPEGMPRVISVGRLDFNSEGLLLLTNDGELARHLENPRTGWLRRYRVRAFDQRAHDQHMHGRITQEVLDRLSGGVEIDGVRYGPVEARLDRESEGGNIWLTMGLREGKNREVRRILEHLGLVVNRLIRVSFGPFQLGDLPPGAVEEIRPRVIAQQLGDEVARALGLSAPRPGAEGRPPRATPVETRRKTPRKARRKPVRKASGEASPDAPPRAFREGSGSRKTAAKGGAAPRIRAGRNSPAGESSGQDRVSQDRTRKESSGRSRSGGPSAARPKARLAGETSGQDRARKEPSGRSRSGGASAARPKARLAGESSGQDRTRKESSGWSRSGGPSAARPKARLAGETSGQDRTRKESSGRSRSGGPSAARPKARNGAGKETASRGRRGGSSAPGKPRRPRRP